MKRNNLAALDTICNYTGLVSSAVAGIAMSPYFTTVFGEYANTVLTLGALGGLMLPGVSYHFSPQPKISDEKPKEYAAMQFIRNMFIGTAFWEGGSAAKNQVPVITVAILSILGIGGELFQRKSKKELEKILFEERSSTLDHS